MALQRLREILGILVISGNVILGVTIIVLHLSGGYTPDELRTSLFVLAPVLTPYTLWIVRNFLRPNTGTKVEVSRSVAWLLVGLVLSFLVMLEAVCFLKAFNLGVTEFSQFLTLLGTVEILFGAGLVELMEGLFR